MNETIVVHALKNVWCNPEQDRQHILAVKRVTPPLGCLNFANVMMGKLNLPTQFQRYHVFQVGHLHTYFLNLLMHVPEWQVAKWFKVSDAMNAGRLMVDIYNDRGVQIPRFETYYMLTNNGTLLFAIKENDQVPVPYNLTQFYIRFYTNAYHALEENGVVKNGIYTKGMAFKNTQEILDFQMEYMTLVQKPGALMVFKNGFMTDEVSLVRFGIGDVCEVVYDNSIQYVFDVPVQSLERFESILDNKAKLLVRLMWDENPDVIHYHDDLDFYLHYRDNGAVRGTYYHRNLPDACRMVTHCDYSLNADNVVRQIDSLSMRDTLNLSQVTLRVYVRMSGYHRPLVYDNNRIFELYKLPPDQIKQAMVGVNATLPIWKAENLENSAYCQIMRSYPEDVSLKTVEDAYGYNGISKVVADTPLFTKTWGQDKVVDVPVGLRRLSTAYEYSADGKLLGFYHHDDSELYICRDTAAAYVEMLVGTGSHAPDCRFGKNNIALPPSADFRVYYLDVTSGVWSDITGSSNWDNVNGVLKYDDVGFDYLLMVRTDYKFLSYELDFSSTEGVLFFTLSEMQDRGDGLKHHVLNVPYGQWDVFLNGNILTEGIDFIVDFPKVTILNKNYLNTPAETATQHVVVRGTGFCDRDLKWSKPDMVGFIEHGMLLGNNRFDIKEDKVQHISVNGCLKHRTEVLFSDDHSGISVLNAINGQPYRISNTYVPVYKFSVSNTSELISKALTTDKAVSAYLTPKLPEPDRSAVSAIPSRYPVYSPFISRILETLSHGELDNELMAKPLTEMRVIEICRRYEHLLKSDTTQPENDIDTKFVIVHPSIGMQVTELNVLQYRFLKKAVDMYCNGLVELSEFVKVI